MNGSKLFKFQSANRFLVVGHFFQDGEKKKKNCAKIKLEIEKRKHQ